MGAFTGDVSELHGDDAADILAAAGIEAPAGLADVVVRGRLARDPFASTGSVSAKQANQAADFQPAPAPPWSGLPWKWILGGLALLLALGLLRGR